MIGFAEVANVNCSVLAPPHRHRDGACTPLPCKVCQAEAVYVSRQGEPYCVHHWLQRFIAPWIK